MAALIDATTGYANDVADWTDTTPQPDSADSGAKVVNPASLSTFLWSQFVLIEGVTHDTSSGGGTLESWGVIE